MSNATTPPFEDPQLSRTGVVGPFGPLLCDLKTKVDIDTDALIRRFYAENGTDTSAYIRDLLYQKFHGKTYTACVLEAAKRREEVMFGKGPVGGLLGTAA